jgi:tetratricopeptide (TPR) repeat protein
VPEVTDFLLLAQAHYRMKQYVQVVAALDQIATLGLVMNPRQMHQALALYYQAGAYAQCEDLLRRLLQLEPDNADNWHQLASVYLQQNKKRQALDELTLAREKRVPFSADQLVLLADLQAFHKNPYGAAELLQQAMDQQEIPGDAKNYRKLFEYWFLAREEQKMQAALSRAARLSGDTELYLYLAQLQMEQRAWQAMHQTMLAACAEQLADRYVGRANVLLGISQLKLGDAVNARRSFINATLIAGANTQAAQWLEFMGAEPATRKESRRIVGVCYGSIDKQQAEDGTLIVDAPEAAADPGVEFQIKTVPSLRLFYASYEMPLAELAAQAKSQVVRMGVSLVKSGGSVDGPVQLISQGDLPAQGDPTWQLALPSSGSPRASGRFRVRTTAAFKCAYTALQGAGPELAEQALAFAGALQEAGYSLSGERRLVLPSRDNGSGNIKVELQIGIQ